MFLLNEFERLLQNTPNDQQPTQRRTKVQMREVGRVDVNKFLSLKKIRIQEIDIRKELSGHHDSFDLKSCISNRNYLTLDIQFAHLMKQLVLDRLAQIPERSYPAARLMICDHEAYRNLLKFEYVVKKIYPKQDLHRFLLQKPPYNVTSVVLLTDIMNMIQRVGRPLALIKNNQTVNYDYSIIKQIFPYLRITDLIVVLGEIGSLKLRTFTMNASKSHQTIQFLTHFARSTQLIELLPIRNKIGGQHQLFSNISVLRIPNYTEMTPPEKDDQPQRKIFVNAHLEPTLLQLSFIAHRLYELIGQLEWHLDTITFRVGDPNGFSKIFAQIIHSIEKSESSVSASAAKDQTQVPARVLVLDRFFDFQGLLRHTDRYGPFLEQENTLFYNDGLSNLRLNDTDHLDELLQCTSLTDALKTILEYGTKDIDEMRKNSPHHQARTDNQNDNVYRSNSSFTTHAIRRHLDTVKSVYKSLSGGYLLVLKLESSLTQIMEQIHKCDVNVNDEVHMGDIIERIERVTTVLNQLITLPNKSLVLMDMIRIALMLIDLINVILYLCPRNSASSAKLAEIKFKLMARSEFRATIVLKEDPRDVNFKHKDSPGQYQAIDLREKFARFDALSKTNCGHTATASLEKIIEQFYLRKLDSKSYPRLKRPASPQGLAKNVSRNKILVLVLGSITFDELTRIKSLENTLMQKRRVRDRTAGDIVLICSDIIRPDEFVGSL